MNNEEIIKKASLSFENSFSEKNYYDLQTQDENHLDLILKKLKLSPGKNILDLGTGTGYLAFPIAKLDKSYSIIGIDIVKETISRNNNEAIKKGLENLQFVVYDGIELPFEDNSFDIIISRYAIHHFPNIKKSRQ